jgi:hypothetical protein
VRTVQLDNPNDRIAEMWDIAQQLAANSPNTHGAF